MSFHAEIIWTTHPALEIVSKNATDEVLDVYIQAYGIDDARSLKTYTYQTAQVNGTERLFIIRTESITEQAQHALLKLLEEPPAQVRIVFVLRSGIAILPTVLSRCFIHPPRMESASAVFTEFLQLSYAERLALIDECHTKKRIEWFNALQAGLGEWLANAKVVHSFPLYNQLFGAYLVLGTRGASNKMLCEHIALSMPVKYH